METEKNIDPQNPPTEQLAVPETARKIAQEYCGEPSSKNLEQKYLWLRGAFQQMLKLRGEMSQRLQQAARMSGPKLTELLDLREGTEAIVEGYAMSRITLDRLRSSLDALRALVEVESGRIEEESKIAETLGQALGEASVDAAQARSVLQLLGKLHTSRETGEEVPTFRP